MEKEFAIEQTGNYKLIIQSNSNEEQSSGAIGPFRCRKKSLGFYHHIF